jgi:hypothetical protein
MSLTCPKCGRSVPEDSVYCPYCAHGLKPSARTPQVSAAGVLMIAVAISSFILLIMSINGLAEIYTWVPRLVAQGWFIYGQSLTILSAVGFIAASTAAALSLKRKSYVWTVVSALASTLLGLATFAVSVIIPDFNLKNSFFYYFLPLFLTPLIGTLLVLRRKHEFK